MGRWGGDLGGVGGRKSVIRIHAMKKIQYKRKKIHNNVIKVGFYLNKKDNDPYKRKQSKHIGIWLLLKHF